MKATKFTMTVQIEVLSLDSVPCLIGNMLEQLHGEFHRGSLTADDGDTISWSTASTPVEI